MKMLEYRPTGLWCKHDFSINKHYWNKNGLEHAYEIRKKNLIDIRTVLCEQEIINWLQGKTLLGVSQKGVLLDDHDDDIGIYSSQRDAILSDVKIILERIGFTLIRNTEDIISFERNFRYVDICLFRPVSTTEIGYAQKKFDNTHFNQLDKIIWQEIEFNVPTNTADLLRKMYPIASVQDGVNTGNKKFANIPSNFIRIINCIKSPQHILNYAKSLVIRGIKIFRYPLKYIYHVIYYLPPDLCRIAIHAQQTKRKKNILLTENDFLELLIEPDDSFNWKWRYRHLALVTQDGEHRKIRDILNYLSSENTRKDIDEKLDETDTSMPFFPPTNHDMRFWWGGNNYFWNCVINEFRKNVVPYSKANDYIASGKKPLLYSNEYYESLPLMTDAEIKKLLITEPIEIENGAITSGKHRAFAMIGRLLSDKPYIHFRAEVRK